MNPEIPIDYPSGPPPLLRGKTYVAPRKELGPNNIVPDGSPLRDTWCIRGNPLFFVSPEDLMRIVKVFMSNRDKYLDMTTAEDCELYWACGDGKEQLMAAVIIFFREKFTHSPELFAGDNESIEQQLFKSLNEYADYPRNLIPTLYGLM
jgi:hypothetical protein